MRRETFWLDTPDGVRLHGRAWVPGREPRGVVQVAHGMAEHIGRYEDVAQALVAAGWAVVGHDHRGHGQTVSPARGHMADRHGWDKVVNDLLRVTGTIRDTFGDVPVVLFGHSWGSMLARDYASRWGHHLAGLVLMGTAADPGVLGRVGVGIGRSLALVRGARPSAMLDKLTFGGFNKPFAPARTDFDWLTRDAAEVDAYLADPECGFACTPAFYADLAAGARRVNQPGCVALVPKDLPILVLAGDADPVGDFGRGIGRVVDLLDGRGGRPTTVHLYENARHELLKEENRDEVISDLVGWLDQISPDPNQEKQ